MKTKIPEPKRLPSGSWHVRLRVGGQTYYITKPTRSEAIAEAAAVKSGLKSAIQAPGRELTLTQAIDRYIADRQNVLSPSTIRGYRIIQRNRFRGLMTARISTITPQRWQASVNAEARVVSAKTLKNACGFIASVVADSTGQHLSARLPQVVAGDHPYLSPAQIPVFLDAVHGDSVETAALLALSSLRQSEIMALQWQDVDLAAGVIHVRGAAVPDEHNQLVRKKETKNAASRRTVPIIPPLRPVLESAARGSGPVITISTSWMYKRINALCRDCGLPEVGVHGLRHSFASLAYELRLPEKATMRIGGWSDDRTMKKIYTHLSQASVDSYEAQLVQFYKIGDEKGDKK